jgi:alkylation response protein AidB-like acyl-CoA dehydrogenase
MTWPTEFGGQGRTPLERFVVFESLIATGAPIASAWLADRQIGPSLLQFGTDDQRRRFLPDLVTGRSRWCIGMSEPDAGSDVAAVSTRAERDGDHWVINGAKVWTSAAHEATWCYMVARTDREAPPHRGLSDILVDMSTPGIEVRPIKDMSGDAHFNEVILTDVRVPVENLVGEENNSFRQIMRQMEHERGGIDRLVSNRALYLDCLEIADRSDPLVRQEIAAIESSYRITRHLIIQEVVGQARPGWSALTKTAGTDLEQRIASFCASVLGPAAIAPDSPLARRTARNVCYAPGYTLMGGTTQILRNILAERVLGLPR